jgi:Bacterial extracellular solute-binding proteins, family 3
MSTADPQLPYVRSLVALGMALAGANVDVQLVSLEMYQSRSLMELASGNSSIDLMWTMTDRERESSGVLPIRIPIDRGLMGWRVLLVRKGDLARWVELDSLAKLKKRVAGQGHDWPDTAILRANGLQVSTSSSYAALFRMLVSGRFDYFPRAVMEVDAELADNRHPDLAIVPNLMLHYPAAAYLFVSPRRPDLAKLLSTGLEKAVAEGSLQQLHQAHFGALIKAHPVSRDRVLKLKNPLLPPLTPTLRRELWLQPGDPG